MQIDETLDTLTRAAEIEQMLDASGLNWSVSKVTLKDDGGEEAPSVGLKRSDNGRIISVRKPGYEVFQNEQLAEIIYKISDKIGLETTTGFELKGGARVSLQLKSNTFEGIGENDGTIQTNITAINSFDGSTGLAFGSTSIDIVCKNTFFAAYKQMKNKFRHSKGLQEKVDKAIEVIMQVRAEEEVIFQKFKRMSEVPLSRKLAHQVIAELTGVDLSLTAQQLAEDFSVIKINQAKGIMQAVKEETAYKGDTAWGLFSGVTKYTTHQISAPKRENGRLESKMFGNAHAFDHKAFNILTSQFN
jgi:phage/plasmid-like protein (TIGR03299 family)